MSSQTQNQTREELLANLERYWCAQVSEVKRSFLGRKGVETKASWRKGHYDLAIARFLRSLTDEKLQAEGDELTALGIRWRR